MWYVFKSALNKVSWKRYELGDEKFDTYGDARKYIRDKADEYCKFCIDNIDCNSYVEDYGNDVYVNVDFLCIRIDFNIYNGKNIGRE